MVNFTFIYKDNHYKMKENENLYISDVLKKYLNSINRDYKNFEFIYKGNKINLNGKIKINQLQNNNIIIFVFNLKPNLKCQKLPNIICPECKNLALLNINNIDYKISIINCMNNHQCKNSSLNNYIESQIIDESKIKCELCKNPKNLYGEEFYKCSCNLYICGLCFEHHYAMTKHKLVKYKYLFYKCLNHYEDFYSYCHNCHINLCLECNEQHKKAKHKITEIKKIKPKENKKKEEIKNNLKKNINNIYKYKNEINVLNQFFNSYISNLNQNLDKSINLHNKIIDSLEILKNYEEVMNVKDFKYEKYNKELNDILYRNIKDRFKYLLDICNISNVIKINYSISSEGKIKLFGKKFVENNKNNCFLFINNKLIELCEYYTIDKSETIYELSVDLIEVKTITDISYMFSECNLLTNLDFSKWNNENVTDMSYMFSNCDSLSSLPERTSYNNASFLAFLTTPVTFDFSNFNTSNVINMSYLFSNCVNLTKIPDISKWKTNKVKNMEGLFNNCSNLVSLPNINIWNVEKVTHMNRMFYGCKSLSTLPNLSEWTPNCVTDISNMFNNCQNITSIPDISEWNTNNVTDMNNLFNNCSKLFSLPDLSKWNIHNVTNLSYMFNNCSMLSKIPDISKWNTNKVITMKNMFNNCSSILSLPDLSNWDTYNVKDMSYLFKDCTSLYYSPTISNWKTNSLKDMSYMFYNCKSKLIPELFSWNFNNVKKMEKAFDFNDLNKNSNNIKSQYKVIKKIGLLKFKSFNSLNSVIQCFCSIEKFINYFKFSYNQSNNNNNLCSSFKLILDKLWPDKNEVGTIENYLELKEFNDKIQKMNFINCQSSTNTIENLVDFIIETLHKELNKLSGDSIESEEIVDKRDKSLSFAYYTQNFTERNQSVISDLFYAAICNKIQCYKCKNIFFDFQTYSYLNYQLEDILEFKKQINNTFCEITTYDFFLYNLKFVDLKDEKQIFCDFCKEKCNFLSTKYLAFCPEILILVINRKKENNIKINIIEYINLAQFIEYKTTGYLFKLIGVVSSFEKENNKKDIIAYCRDPISNDWYRYNDNEITACDFKNEISNVTKPYLLFYQKIK